MTLGGLLSAPPAIVAAGVDVFSDALRAQGAEVHDVDWRPPGFGDPADLAALALDPRRNSANRVAVERILAAGSQLVDVRPAREVIGLADRYFLNAFGTLHDVGLYSIGASFGLTVKLFVGAPT